MEKYKVIHSRVGLVVDLVIQNVGRLEFEDELRVAELRTPTHPPWESSRWCRKLLDVRLVLDILGIRTFEAVPKSILSVKKLLAFTKFSLEIDYCTIVLHLRRVLCLTFPKTMFRNAYSELNCLIDTTKYVMQTKKK